jgi:hypothetical protein
LYCGIIACFVCVAWLMASIACALFSFMFQIRVSTVLLLDGVSSLDCSVSSCPSRIWLGDNLVVSFFRLLCTAVTMANQWVQSSGEADVTNCKYCSTHWFFLSDIPSVYGWKADDKFWLIFNCCARLLPKWDVNRGSRSLITFVGSLNHL